MVFFRKGAEDWVILVVGVAIALIIVYLMFLAGVPFITSIVESAFGG